MTTGNTSTGSALAVSLGNIASALYAIGIAGIFFWSWRMPTLWDFSSMATLGYATVGYIVLGIWQKLGEAEGDAGKNQRRVDFFFSLAPLIPIVGLFWMVSQKNWTMTQYDWDVVGFALLAVVLDLALIPAIKKIRGSGAAGGVHTP